MASSAHPQTSAFPGKQANTRATDMTVKSKIGLDAIERAHRALEALPQYQPDELTKAQAVKKLLGSIRATRSKGYSLAAISELFSECGIPITTGALRAYLSDASGAGGKKKRRPVKHGADTRKGVAPATSKGNAETATARSGNGGAAAGGLDVHQDLENL